jgi:Small-conductance mechanosensitive channel
MQALIEIPVYGDAPFEEIKRIIDNSNKNLNLKQLKITKKPVVTGFSNQNDGTFVLQISAFTKAGEQFNVKNKLLQKYLTTLKENNIKLPK